MPRQFKNRKPYIIVFCEGESEQAYVEFLKKEFKDEAVLKYPKGTGLFEEANDKFKKDPQYRDYAEVTDEIWFFFDMELKDAPKWSNRLAIIKRLRNLRKKPNIKVRLLVTTGCIEYWLMLHYQMFIPPIQTVAEKEKILEELKKKEPTYEKGDSVATAKIAANYQTATKNAPKTVSRLLEEGLPEIGDTDKRNEWLCTHSVTFSTVYEAIEFLESLK